MIFMEVIIQIHKFWCYQSVTNCWTNLKFFTRPYFKLTTWDLWPFVNSRIIKQTYFRSHCEAESEEQLILPVSSIANRAKCSLSPQVDLFLTGRPVNVTVGWAKPSSSLPTGNPIPPLIIRSTAPCVVYILHSSMSLWWSPICTEWVCLHCTGIRGT